jgi:hypothetical protein
LGYFSKEGLVMKEYELKLGKQIIKIMRAVDAFHEEVYKRRDKSKPGYSFFWSLATNATYGNTGDFFCMWAIPNTPINVIRTGRIELAFAGEMKFFERYRKELIKAYIRKTEEPFIVDDRMQGVDCCYCEDETPHLHKSIKTA